MIKKIYLILTISLLTVLLACNPTVIEPPIDNNPPDEVNPPIEDKIAPIISISSEYKVSMIIQNSEIELEEFLRQGVTAIDNIDGNITNKIIMDALDLDITTPGVYRVYFYVVDKAGNMSEVIDKTINVKVSEGIIAKYDVYLDPIPGEKPKPGPQSVFQGAWYHKVDSAKDSWLGIEGTITVPEYKIERYNDTYNNTIPADPNVKNLDNPSIYLGGQASTESDVGISLSRVQLDIGGTGAISTGSYAFRPFWRYITNVEQDVGTYDLENGRRYAVSTAGGNNMIANWYFGDTQYYYLPGDKIRIIVHSPEPQYLQLQIEVIEKSTLPFSVQLRSENNWEDPADFISPVFRSPGHGVSQAKYKRVNAIDQSGNEGKPIIPTTSQVKYAIWESVYLYRKINDKMYRVPFNESRSSSINSPYADRITATSIDPITGGSSVYIHPGSTSIPVNFYKQVIDALNYISVNV